MSVTELNLDPVQCRQRQRKLREAMGQLDLQQAIFTQHENIQYLTGFRPHRLMAALAYLDPEGTCWLVAPNSRPEQAAADKIVTFEAQWTATLRQDQVQAAAATLSEQATIPKGSRIGAETSVAGSQILELFGANGAPGAVNMEPHLWKLRRHKDADELTMIQRAIECTEAMYETARKVIRPGISELAVYNALQSAAVEVAGEPLGSLGNDFQCNSPGGPPRQRADQAGELHILDLGPVYRGYWADNCRTISVDGKPSQAQQEAWQVIVAVLEMVEATVKPGFSCRQLFAQAKAMLDDFRPGSFRHHLGHGFGLFPHETPHLNPNWDDVFEQGDVFTAEPGLYYDQLKAGIRLEQNYVVSADGVQRLTTHPLDL